MSQTEHKAKLAIALEMRSKDGERLWHRVQGDTKFENEKALRRYAACMRLCNWLQNQLKK